MSSGGNQTHFAVPRMHPWSIGIPYLLALSHGGRWFVTLHQDFYVGWAREPQCPTVASLTPLRVKDSP